MTTNWMDEAACKGMDPEIFFVDTRRWISPDAEKALEACSRCTVKDVCRQENDKELWGIWGGTTAEERQGLRVQYGRPTFCKVCDKKFMTLKKETLCSDECREISRVKSRSKYETLR